MLIDYTEDYRQADVPARLGEAIGEFIARAARDGNGVSSAGWQPSSAGASRRIPGGRITMTDGPFVETKELLGGDAIVDAMTEEAQPAT